MKFTSKENENLLTLAAISPKAVAAAPKNRRVLAVPAAPEIFRAGTGIVPKFSSGRPASEIGSQKSLCFQWISCGFGLGMAKAKSESLEPKQSTKQLN